MGRACRDGATRRSCRSVWLETGRRRCSSRDAGVGREAILSDGVLLDEQL